MRFDTLEDWLRWQETLHPRPIDLGLARVAEVWRRLHPEGLHCPVITVGGTNGKGSCVAMLDAILRAGGYRTGAYSSPHLLHYNERIRLDGEPADDRAICEAFERVDAARGEVSLTYFEFGTLAALDLFARARPDAVALEVGLGGRLDAVNILDADVALVSGIGLDHADWLGSDLDGIGREKAGIFRPDRPAVVGQPDAPAGLLEGARAVGARLLLAGRDFGHERSGQEWIWRGPGRVRHGLPLPALRGGWQLRNAAAVLTALDCLSERLPLGQDAVRTGLRTVRLPGRLQVIPGQPTLVLDVAHNLQAVAGLARDLGDLPCAGVARAVFGCYRDKDGPGMIRTLAPRVDLWYPAPLEGPRALSAAGLDGILAEAGVARAAGRFDGVGAALAAALAQSAPADRILVTGSFMTVAGALQYLETSGRSGLI